MIFIIKNIKNFSINLFHRSPLFNHSRVVWEYAYITVRASVAITFKRETNSYSDYQKKLFNKIKKVNKKVLGYNKIANYLNNQNIKTSYGNTFNNNNVYSIFKKGLLKNKRLKKYKMIINDVHIEYHKKYLLRFEF